MMQAGIDPHYNSLYLRTPEPKRSSKLFRISPEKIEDTLQTQKPLNLVFQPDH